MQQFIFLFLMYVSKLLGVFCKSQREHGTVRLMTGDIALDDIFDYMVAVLYLKQPICAGTAISPNVILTACSCFTDPHSGALYEADDLTISYGHAYWVKGLRRNVEAIIRHQAYVPETMSNDIALLMLRDHLPEGGALAKLHHLVGETHRNYDCFVAGWGFPYRNKLKKMLLKSSAVLLYAPVKVTSPTVCRFTYKTLVKSYHICVYEEGTTRQACNGDTGGPLLCDGFQVGIISNHPECYNFKPELYTRVSSYYDWIKSSIDTFVESSDKEIYEY